MATKNKIQRTQWLSIEPGRLRHQIQIQSVSSTNDGFGQPPQTWSTIDSSWAEVKTITERELYQSGELSSQLTHSIAMRWKATVVKAGMRILFGTQKFHVQAVVNVDERSTIRKFLCLELPS